MLLCHPLALSRVCPARGEDGTRVTFKEQLNLLVSALANNHVLERITFTECHSFFTTLRLLQAAGAVGAFLQEIASSASWVRVCSSQLLSPLLAVVAVGSFLLSASHPGGPSS